MLEFFSENYQRLLFVQNFVKKLHRRCLTAIIVIISICPLSKTILSMTSTRLNDKYFTKNYSMHFGTKVNYLLIFFSEQSRKVKVVIPKESKQTIMGLYQYY